MMKNLKTFKTNKEDFSWKDIHVRYQSQLYNAPCWAISPSQNGDYLVSGGSDGKIHLSQNLNNFDEIKTYEEHKSDIVSLAWNSTNFFLSGSFDGTARLFHPSQNSSLGIFAHDDSVTCLSFHPLSDQKFVVGTFSNQAFLWDVQKNVVLKIFKFSFPLTACTFSPNGDLIVFGLLSGHCYVYSSESYSYITHFLVTSSRNKSAIGKKINSLQFVNDRLLLIATCDSRVRLYSMDNFRVVHKYVGHVNINSNMKISISPTGKHFMIPSEKNGSIFIYSVENSENFHGKNFLTKNFRNISNIIEGFRVGKSTLISDSCFLPNSTDKCFQCAACDKNGYVYLISSK